MLLVMATMRIRLTAYSLAGMQAPDHARRQPRGDIAYARATLTRAATDLVGFYERIAVLVGRPFPGQVLLPVHVPAFPGLEDSDGAGRSGEADAADDDRGVTLLSRSGATSVASAGGAGGAAGGSGEDGPDGQDLVRVITAPHHPHLLWVNEHLQHLSSHAGAITDPAAHVAEQRRLPWWR